MRKNLILTLGLVVSVAFLAMPAWGALIPHQDSGATNACKECHDTAAGTPSLRGWTGGGVATSGTGWEAKPISRLCYGCHESGPGYLTTPANDMSGWAYNAGAHGEVKTDAPAHPEGTTAVSGAIEATNLPYVALASLECTSCHNVHDSDSRPFNQRASYQALCDDCHIGRTNNAGNRGTLNTTTISGGDHAYSTHPTNRPMGSDVGTINIQTVADMADEMKVTIGSAATGGYELGGHLSNATGDGGNYDCMTCHAVHGVPDQGTGIGDAIGVNDLLALDNTTGGAGGNSLLCAGCHYGGDAGEQVGTTTVAVGSYSDHPIDANTNGAYYPSGVALPGIWTSLPYNDRGPQAFYGTDPYQPACVNCHDVHGGITATSLLRGPQASGDDTSFDYDTWCFVCHTNSQVTPANHHSNVNNAAWSVLSCGDCHGAAGTSDWTAHNGFWTWVTTPAAGDSSFCEACHPTNDPLALSASLELKPTNDFTGFTFANVGHGANRGSGEGSSHHYGVADSGITNITKKQDAWADSGGISEWGPGTNEIICESCHNILVNGDSDNQGLTEGWEANLLLELYEDDTPGTATGVEYNDYYDSDAPGTGNTDSALCRGCHNYSGSPASFVHNPAAHTVIGHTYPAGQTPYGRSTTTVLTGGTCPDATTADFSAAPGILSYPATDTLDCDSCHRPHSADPNSEETDSVYRILEDTTADTHGTTICTQCHDTEVQCNQ